MAARPIRVLVVDDDERFASFVVSVLSSEPDVEVVGEASDGLEALALAAELHPDVVVMDLNMPRMGGAEATRLLRQGSKSIRVILVTASGNGEVEAARSFGAVTRLDKRDVDRELAAAVRAIVRDGA